MSINLYSKDSVDSLLSAKLSDAPSDGSTYGRKDGAWEVVSGGGGGAVWGSITGTLGDQTDLSYELSLKATLASPYFTGGITADGGVTIPGPSGSSTFTYSGLILAAGSAGITFPDSTTQTTAATAGINLGDAFSVANVMTVAFSGSYPSPGQWQIDFRPVNNYIANAVSIYVENADGSISQDVKGSVSTSSNWSYTTGYDTFPADTYLYLKVNGIKATMPINYI
jgi:hypothetical protein